jgi:hypothetical protein
MPVLVFTDYSCVFGHGGHTGDHGTKNAVILFAGLLRDSVLLCGAL